MFLLFFFLAMLPSFLFIPVLSTGISVGLMLAYKKYSRFILFFFIIGISLPILRYTPFLDDDSSYHYFAAFSFSAYDNFLDLFSDLQEGVRFGRYDYQDYPIFGYFLYIFSKTYTYSLISFFACIITYYCYTFVIVDVFRRENMSKIGFLIIFLGVFLSNNYRYTTSGMRYCMAMAILMLLFYLDSIRYREGNKLFYFLYLIPQFIHASSLLFIAMRFSLFLLKRVTFIKSFLVFFIFPFLLYVFPFLARFVELPYLDMFASKIETYSSNDSFEEIMESATLQLRMLVGVGVIFTYVCLFVYIYVRKRLVLARYENFIILTYYFSLLSLGTVPFLNIYDRNLFILYPMITISIGILLMNLDTITVSNNRKLIRLVGGCVCFVCMLIGLLYNRNFPLHLLDYSLIDLFISNIFNFFSNLPIYYY